jgi:hypothetical protein
LWQQNEEVRRSALRCPLRVDAVDKGVVMPVEQ